MPYRSAFADDASFGKIATGHRPGSGGKIKRGTTTHGVRLAGLDFVRDEFRCHPAKEFSLDRSPEAREKITSWFIGTPKAEAASNYAATISGAADVFDALLTKLEIAQ